MSDKFYVGLDITGFQDQGIHKPVSRVTLFLDDENVVTAGDDTGTEITANCPDGTQEMAETILARLRGYRYHSYTADAANIDPSAELGDGVDVGGIYSVLSHASDTGDGYRGISAPGEAELEDEYPSAGPMQREFDRQIAKTRSLISKTASEILLQVEGISGEVNSLAVTLDGVTITGPSGQTLIKGSSIETDSLTVNAVNINGQLTADQIDATNLKVNAANITGNLTIGQLPSNVATDSDIPQNTSDLNNDSGFQDATGVTSIVEGTVTTDYVNALGVSASSVQGDIIAINGIERNEYGEELKFAAGLIRVTPAITSNVGAIDLESVGALRLLAGDGDVFIENGIGLYINITSTGTAPGISFNSNIWPEGAQYCGTSTKPWSAVYARTGEIQTSDRNLKESIEQLPQKYLDMMERVSPVRYRMKDGTSHRYHVGFIAQDVESAMQSANINPLEFGGWCKDKDAGGNDIYMLRYEEFIAILWAKIKELEAKINDQSAV